MRRAAFGLAVFLYAAFSSPTPDSPGFVEVLILCLLGFAASGMKCPSAPWARPLALVLVYGATVPLAAGALSGYAAADIVRDLVAFGALAAPFAFASQFPSRDARAQKILLAGLIGVGMIFSLRYLAEAGRGIFALGTIQLDHHFLYLANSPLVAFAAAWLLLEGCFGGAGPVKSFVLVAAALVPAAAMIGMMQRATLALLALAWLGFFIRALVWEPRRACAVAAGAGILAFVAWPLPHLVWESLAQKTFLAGWNARDAEIAAVIDAIRQNALTAVFGAGWGALYQSPAVGDQWVRFTHALFTSLLWKTGWLGLALGAAAVGALVLDALRRLRGDALTLAALILALLPPLFLYGSYKSLCFGLLLLGLACAAPRPLDKNRDGVIIPSGP